MKKGFLLLLLFFTSNIFATQYNTNNSTFTFLDLLVWQVREVGDDNWAEILDPAGTYQQIQYLSVPFQWNPGFRVGVGYNHKENPWDVQLYYTWYKTQGIDRASVNTGEIHSSFAANFYANNPRGDNISGPYYHQAGINWGVFFNSLDLELGRVIKTNSLLNLRPFVGIKGGIINQTINTNWQTPFNPTNVLNPTPVPITTFSASTEKITNNFKGVGPSAGLDTTWNLFKAPNHSLSLIGNFSGAFLWGYWTITDLYQDNTPVSISVLNDSLSTAAPMARGYLGFEWESLFNNKNLKLRLGYENQIWFNQLRYYSFDMGKSNNSLMLQGGVLDFVFTFN